MSSSRETSLLRSPRANLQALLSQHLKPGETLPPAYFDLAYGSLLPADAENKLHHRKLYLVLDLDETLVYAHRLAPDETPVGTLVHVRGSPYDVVPRPGLKFFLNMACKNFVVYLYTMGDADYAHAVLKVIDPEDKYFRGGACCWRPTESRQHKSLARVVCDRRMALIVDDSVDVWGGDLANLCLTRRFVGDKLDDGLQLLAQQLAQAHANFFQNAPAEGFSLEAPEGSPRCAPTIFSVLAASRGDVLRGCKICLTGIVADLSEEALAVEGVPLAGLIQLYGGELCLSVDQATHLVARRKEGWKSSPKIKKALVRLQDGDAGFFAVWDHWLLDTLTQWKRQPEGDYAVSEEQEDNDGSGDSVAAPLAGGIFGSSRADADGDEAGGLPPRKRPRSADGPTVLGVNGAAPQAVSPE